MSFISRNWKVESDQYGAAVITETGRCTASEAAAIEAGCTRRFELITLPNVAGVILKSMDGSVPALVAVTPSTIGRTYNCVKTDGRVEPLAPVQTGGTYSGAAIMRYTMRYQQVGGVA